MTRGSTPSRRDADLALERLYRRHRADVFRFALRAVRDREEAEDVTQAAFLNAYRALLRGRAPRSPRAWLLAIAENVRRSRLRGRRDELPLALVEATVAARDSSVDAAEIRTALERLPASQREAVVLRELAGLSYAEIADTLGVSVGSVQMLVFRGRRALRGQLAAARGRGAAALLPSLHGWFHGAAGGGAVSRAAAAAGVAVFGVALPGGVPGDRPDLSPPRQVFAPVAAAPPAAAPAATLRSGRPARAESPATRIRLVPPAASPARRVVRPTAPAAVAAPAAVEVAPSAAAEAGGEAGASPVAPAPLELSFPAPAAAGPPPPEAGGSALLDLVPPTPGDPLSGVTSGDAPAALPPVPSAPVTVDDAPLVEVDAPELPILSP